jgi:hypothetical protein
MNKVEFDVLSYSEKPIEAKSVIELYKDAGWWEERKELDLEAVLKSGIFPPLFRWEKYRTNFNG